MKPSYDDKNDNCILSSSNEDVAVICLETPLSSRGIGLNPKNLEELLTAMNESWQSEETAKLTSILTEDDTVDSREIKKTKSRRGGKRRPKTKQEA